MLKPEQVPDEVVATLVNALYDNRVDVAWSDARAALAAALAAWPGVTVNTHHDNMGEYNAIHLPLSTENTND